MLVYVACWPLLASLAGKLIPAIGNGELSVVIKVIAQSLGLFLIQKFAQFGQDTLLAGPALRVSQDIRTHLFEQLQRIQLGTIEKLSSGDLTYRLTEDADRVGEILYKTIQDTTPSLLQLITVFGYMLWLDWQLSFSTLLLAPLIILLVSKFGEKVIKAAEISQRQVSELAGLLAEAIQGLPLVRAYAAEPWLQKRFNNEVDLHRKARYETLRLLALQHPVVGFIEAAGILTILVFGAIRIQSGGMNGESFSSYVAALLMLIDPISHLTTNFNELQQGKASLRRLVDIENLPREIIQTKSLKSINSFNGEIQFNHVSFSYESGINVIKDLSLRIEAGKVLAIVGPSGSGKSTLISLLLCFIRPDEGTILVDGMHLDNVNTIELRKQIALVPQQGRIFSGTVAEAISLGRKATKAEIIRAAKQANAHNFIKLLPKGYETQIEEQGSNFSGGQLQRIAIARAVLGNPSLILLDEATSSLDAESEVAVQIGLKQAMEGRTVIVIAHRLSTVQEADQIIVMEKGRICQKGTHDELMRNTGRYRELCEKQIIRESSK